MPSPARRTTLLAAALLWTAAAASAESRGKFAPPAGKTLFIVGSDIPTNDEYVKAFGKVPAGFMTYTSLRTLEGLDEPVDRGGGEQHAAALAEKYPNAVLQVGLWLVDDLDDTAAGRLDENIDRLAAWIAALRRPVFLRIGYEFDGPHNHYDPSGYKTAFRRIVKRFRAKGVDNAAFVWHSYASHITRPLTDWYPGDDVVDWFAVSYFAQSGLVLNEMADLARAHGKPLMVAEATPYGTGVGEGETSWNKWYGPFFKFVNKCDAAAVCYINYDWEGLPLFRGQGWGDARVQTDPALAAKWRKEVEGPRYVHASPALFKRLGYAPR